jgi:hypothetical protein
MLVVVVGARKGVEQGQPRQRCRRQAGLADTSRQGQRFVDRAAQRSPFAGDQLGEREPFQAVDDRHAGTALPGAGHHGRVEQARRLVVAEVERGVAEVPQYVEVFDVAPGLEGALERVHCLRLVAVSRSGQRSQQQLQASCAR